MHYGIVGFGPVGALFAAHLAQAGHKVSVSCRNTYKCEYLLKHKLKVSGELQTETQLTDVFTDMEQFVRAEPDVILICTKSCYSEEILRQIKAYGPREETVLVSCQNGIDVEEQITEIFGPDRALRMVLNFGVNFISRTEIQVAWSFEHYLSEKENMGSVCRQICDDLNQAGLKVELVKNYKEEAFKKAILNSALGSVCALTHMTMGEAMEEAEMLRLVREFVRESIEVAEASGYALGESWLDTAIDYLSKGGNHKPSILVDIEKGRMTENEAHCGQLFRRAEELGIQVPVIQTTYYFMKNLERTVILNSYVSRSAKEEVA